MDFKTFTSFSTLYTAIETIFYEVCSNKSTNIALSGGSLRKVYEEIAKGLPVSTLRGQTFWQVDERFVPKNDPNSNYKLITETFKKRNFNLNYFDAEIIDWHSADFDEERAVNLALEDYEAMLKEQKVKFDLCILGVGPDGHIGSLFPNCDALEEEKKLVAHTQTEVFDVRDRFTLTYPQIFRSKQILVVLQGKAKNDIYKRMKANNISYLEFPANKLHEHSNVTVLYGDY